MIRLVNPFNREIDNFDVQAYKTGCQCVCDSGLYDTGYNGGANYDYPSCGGGCGCKCNFWNAGGNSQRANHSAHS